MDANWAEFDSKYKHIHDWRTYMPGNKREYFDSLDKETQEFIRDILQIVADNEEWD